MNCPEGAIERGSAAADRVRPDLGVTRRETEAKHSPIAGRLGHGHCARRRSSACCDPRGRSSQPATATRTRRCQTLRRYQPRSYDESKIVFRSSHRRTNCPPHPACDGSSRPVQGTRKGVHHRWAVAHLDGASSTCVAKNVAERVLDRQCVPVTKAVLFHSPVWSPPVNHPR